MAGPDASPKPNPSNEARNSKETTNKAQSGKCQVPGERWNGKDDQQLDFDPPVCVCVCVGGAERSFSDSPAEETW